MPRPPDDDESFLGRWSRNKRAQPTEDVVAQPDPAPFEMPVEDLLSEEDIAALPALEDLTPDTDIRVFLQKGVPQALRNAAMRRKWMLVPGIRDHKDPAVDYAWDWNTPGGVPGDGVAPSPERAAQMLRDLFPPRQEAPIAEEDAVKTAAENQASPQVTDSIEIVADPSAGLPVVEDTDKSSTATVSPTEVSEPEIEPPLTRRRHGGALPQ